MKDGFDSRSVEQKPFETGELLEQVAKRSGHATDYMDRHCLRLIADGQAQRGLGADEVPKRPVPLSVGSTPRLPVPLAIPAPEALPSAAPDQVTVPSGHCAARPLRGWA